MKWAKRDLGLEDILDEARFQKLVGDEKEVGDIPHLRLLLFGLCDKN